MNIIQVKIDFEKGLCEKQGITVVTGDYNSTKVVFEFNDSATGRKIFEMKNPSDQLVYVDEIIDNEVVLVGQEDIKDDNGYVKYLDESQNVYWYDEENDVIYNSSYEEATGVELDTLTKQTKEASLFGEEGDYTFEVSLYGENSKLTSVYDYITARKEQVIVDDETVEQYMPLFDNLMQELSNKVAEADFKIGEINEAITETNNLNIDVNKVDKVATIDLTKKDGTHKRVEIRDGYDLDYDWNGTELGIKREDEAEYEYVDLKGEKGDCYFATFEIINGRLKMNKPDNLSQIDFRLSDRGHLEMEVMV